MGEEGGILFGFVFLIVFLVGLFCWRVFVFLVFWDFFFKFVFI